MTEHFSGTAKTTILSGRPFNVSWKIPYPARVVS